MRTGRGAVAPVRSIGRALRRDETFASHLVFLSDHHQICLFLFFFDSRRLPNGSVERFVLGTRKSRLRFIVEQRQIGRRGDRRIPTFSRRKVRWQRREFFSTTLSFASRCFSLLNEAKRKSNRRAKRISLRIELIDWKMNVRLNRFSSQCEIVHQKALGRVQTQLSRVQHVGTFTPIWTLLRDLFEKISSAHSGTFTLYQDLLNDIHLYQEIFQKKVKKHIQKDHDIGRTADLIVQLNHALLNVTKAKEQYHLLALDSERAKRISGNATNYSPGITESNATNPISSKQSERLEKKCRQAQDEYRTALEKYNAVRNDYEKRFHEGLFFFSSTAEQRRARRVSSLQPVRSFKISKSNTSNGCWPFP